MHMPAEVEGIRYHGAGDTYNGELHISHLDISIRYNRPRYCLLRTSQCFYFQSVWSLVMHEEDFIPSIFFYYMLVLITAL